MVFSVVFYMLKDAELEIVFKCSVLGTELPWGLSW